MLSIFGKGDEVSQDNYEPLVEKEWEELSAFLRMKLGSTQQVFDWFISRWGKEARYKVDDESMKSKTSFFYLEGKRENRVLLVAHADTVWDSRYVGYTGEHDIAVEQGNVRSTNMVAGLGADDRAGCAMLSLLKETGHSILVTEGEERRRTQNIPLFSQDGPLFIQINENHQFVVQLDRKNGNDFRCYSVDSDDFVKFIESRTKYIRPDDNDNHHADIEILCRSICGVNFSIGYYNEHCPRHDRPHEHEYLKLTEWKRTLDTVRKLIEPADLPRFPLTR